MSKKAYKEIYVADFETSHEIRNEKEYAWVWVAGWSRLFTDSIHQVGNIKDFVNGLLQGESKKVYFHNLKFDGQFLLNYFLSHKYKFNEKLNEDKQMFYIIDRQGTFYSLSVTFMSKGKVRRCQFIDSFKLYPYSLKVLAKQFKFEDQKGEMDYDLLRYKNHKLTAEEQEYFRKDIVILRKAMEDAYNRDIKKMTIGSNALAEYKSIITEKNFRKLFPLIPVEIDTYLRNAYKGGCCMCMKEYANKVVPIHSYDINSMYPTMLNSKPMPYGMPKYFTGKWVKQNNKLCVQHLKASFNIKPKHLPCIQLKHTRIFQDNEWVENCNYQMDLYLTNIDMEVFFENYDVYDVEYIDGYEFNCITGLFTGYINKWYAIKQNTKDNGERLFSKLFLNNIYGKFGTNPCRKSSRYGLIDGVVKKVNEVEDITDTIYLPVAIFTTSYARQYLLNYAQMNYDTFAYCDTDSIHLTKPANNIPLHDTKLGYFKYEYKGYAKHIKQKTYLVHITHEQKFGEWYEVDKWTPVCAGLNKDMLARENIKIDFDNFVLGATFPKLKAKKVIGGVYLAKEEHTIK